jgi:hypothetical protein
MTDRNVERFGILTGQRHDLADHFGRKRRRRTAAGRVAQTGSHPGGGIRIAPPAAPVTRGLAPNSQSLSRLFDAEAGCRQQNDPGSLRQFLWR